MSYDAVAVVAIAAAPPLAVLPFSVIDAIILAGVNVVVVVIASVAA